MSFTRVMAIVERDARKFRRSPMLLVVTIILPLVQLVILGHAFGGKIQNVPVAVINNDHGPEAVNVQEKLLAVAANARTFIPQPYSDQTQALTDLRAGHVAAVLIIPQNYSRDRLIGLHPKLALVTDNTDQISSSGVEATMSALVNSINAPNAQLAPRDPAQVALDVVELYPYTSYIKYLLPGLITLAVFVTAMIGGGIMYIDDKQRGLHEGYLMTPITKWELILGINLAGAIKAMLAGVTMLLLGSAIAGVHGFMTPARLGSLLLVTALISVALIAMMFLIMARINDPLVPRAIFGVLNTLLFFPSGAIYPIAGFPQWLRAMSVVNPFTYAVHAYRVLLLQQAALSAVVVDLGALALTCVVTLGCATMLFRRAL